MNHMFNVEVAKLVGSNCATVLENIYYWVSHNAANERNFYDGRYWTYNSTKAFTDLFPYLSAGQVERVIKTLKDNNLILIGNYNTNQYDRTRWFALTDFANCIYRNQQMDLSETIIPNAEISEPIPDSNPISKQDNKQIYTPLVENEFQELLKSRQLKRVKNTQHAIDLLRRKLNSLATTDDEKIHILQRSILNCWTDIYKDNYYVPPIQPQEPIPEREPMTPELMKIADDALKGIYNGF